MPINCKGPHLTHAHHSALLLQTGLKSRGFGILDVGFASGNEGYACGGSGSLFKTGVRAPAPPLCTLT